MLVYVTLADRTRHLTALIPDRWPYAPANARIRVVPASTYQGDWGGRWSYDTHTAFINADLDPLVQQGVVAHELAHGRWSRPLPNLPGEEGSTLVAVELFDELRVERYAIAASPFYARQDIRHWLRQTDDDVPIPNKRAAALCYGYTYGHHHSGAVTTDEAAPIRDQFVALMGDAWCLTLDSFLMAAVSAAPGRNLIMLARHWDRYAINPSLTTGL